MTLKVGPGSAKPVGVDRDRELPVRRLRDVTLAEATSRGRPRFVAAASGLTKVGEYLYVVPDDEKHLARLDVRGQAPGMLLRTLEGGLPLAASARKKKKPDFESLVALPKFEGYPFGALLALGSGSTPNRQRAVFFKLDAHGQAVGKPHDVNLARLYQGVAARCTELNIEGAVVAGRTLRLLQRGNGSGSPNMLVNLDLDGFLQALTTGAAPEASLVRSAVKCDLGTLGSVPLCFSDGSMLPDGRMVFSAVAEDTTSAYADGPCAGSAIGVMSADGKLQTLRTVMGHKIEGVHAEPSGKQVRLLMVCDGDDPKKASPLLSALL